MNFEPIIITVQNDSNDVIKEDIEICTPISNIL